MQSLTQTKYIETNMILRDVSSTLLSPHFVPSAAGSSLE